MKVSAVEYLNFLYAHIYCYFISGSTQTIGKAPLADLKSGLATAPTIFAAEEFPKLTILMGRKFEGPGDIDEAMQLVSKSNGLEKTKLLARVKIKLTYYLSTSISTFLISRYIFKIIFRSTPNMLLKP